MADPRPDERALRRTLIQANRSIRIGRAQHPGHTNAVLREYEAAVGPRRARVRMYQIWFRTRGCSYDRAGQCSMCNYGIGPEIDPRRVARSVRLRLAAVPEGSCIYLSPSGSLLDDVEVPPSLREELLAAVAARRPATFSFETRPELFTTAKLDRIGDLLAGTTVIGQVGVESWDPRVRDLCHLKPTPQAAYLAASRMLTQRGFASIANVTLGGLGLSQREAFHDAVSSIRGAREGGYTTQMIFPLSAKRNTLLGWAAEHGLWQPPSLWSLVLVLADACAGEGGGGREADQPASTSLSWFDAQPDAAVAVAPAACPRCRPYLVGALRDFRADPVPARLAGMLAWRGCDCLERARAELAEAPAGAGYPARLAEIARRWESRTGPVEGGGVAGA